MSSILSLLILWTAVSAQPAFSSQDPVQAVRNALQNISKDAGSSFVVTKETLASLPGPGKGIVYTARPLGDDPGARNIPVDVQVKKNGRAVARRTLVFPRKNTEVRVVPLRDIQPGEMLDDRLVKLSAARGSGQPGRYASHLGQVSGSTAKIRLVAGRPIELRHLKQPLAVKRGDKVTVKLNLGTMAVEMAGKALEDGSTGDRIRVVNPRSGRSFMAKLIGPGTAKMEMEE